MKVYVVTSGSYDDYRIECIFSTSELALEWIQSHRYPHEYDIDEYILDARCIK